MPLLPGKKNVGHNIAEMEHAGHPRDVAIAAALRVARKARADGGEADRSANLAKFMEGNHPLVPHVLYHGTDRDIRQFDTEQPRRVDGGMGSANTDTGWYGKGHYFTPHQRAANHFAEGYNSEHGGPNVMPVHVSMKNPFLLKVADYDSGALSMDRALDALGAPKSKDPRILAKRNHQTERLPSEQTAWLKSRGHDGVIMLRQQGHADPAAQAAADAHHAKAQREEWAARDAYHEAVNNHNHPDQDAAFGAARDRYMLARRAQEDAREAKGGPYHPHEFVAFDPHQIKSAIGNRGTFDPREPDITKARGGFTRAAGGKVAFDQTKGMGATPNNSNVDYRGFTAMMRPSRFLELAHKIETPRANSLDAITKHIKAGGALGSPTLNVDFKDTPGRVLSHDGRHRMMAIQKLQGDHPVPVHILGADGARARDIGPDDIHRMRDNMISQRDTQHTGNFEEAHHLGETVPNRDRQTRAAGGGVEKMSRAAQTPGVRIKLANLNKNQHATETWDHNGPEVWLEHIASDVPGAGAEAMRKLVNHADATNTLLRLHHEDDGSGKLINYYKNFGFKADPAGGEIMERPPRQARASGGSVQEKLYTGPIHSPVAGRTDHLPVHVPSGSYVIPADIVSKFGEGNSMAGFKILRRMFAGTPYGGSGAPYGQGAGPYGQKTGATPYGGSGGPYNEKLASGGAAGSVPVIVAGGEYILTPDEVRMAGDGDLDTGHKVLDEFVVRTRKELIKTLQKLPPPKRD